MKIRDAKLSDDWQRILDQEVSADIIKNERVLSRFAFFLGLVTLGVAVWVIFSLNQNVGYLMSLMAGAFTLYHALVVPRLIRHSAKNGRIEFVRWLNVSIEISLPGLATLVDIFFWVPSMG